MISCNGKYLPILVVTQCTFFTRNCQVHFCTGSRIGVKLVQIAGILFRLGLCFICFVSFAHKLFMRHTAYVTEHFQNSIKKITVFLSRLRLICQAVFILAIVFGILFRVLQIAVISIQSKLVPLTFNLDTITCYAHAIDVLHLVKFAHRLFGILHVNGRLVYRSTWHFNVA